MTPAMASAIRAVQRANADLQAALVDFYGDVYTANRMFWRELPHPRSYQRAFFERLALPEPVVSLIDAYFDAMEQRDTVFAEEGAQ